MCSEHLKKKNLFPFLVLCVCVFLKFLLFVYLFGCIGLKHGGSSIFRCGTSLIVAQGLSKCSAGAELLHSMWNLSSQTRD